MQASYDEVLTVRIDDIFESRYELFSIPRPDKQYLDSIEGSIVIRFGDDELYQCVLMPKDGKQYMLESITTAENHIAMRKDFTLAIIKVIAYTQLINREVTIH